MPGNSQRRAAVRKGGKKPAVGSGGQRRRGLEGKGPTPKASEREYHAAHKRASASAKRGASATASAGSGGSGVAGRGGSRPQRRAKGTSEMVYGRNSVVEALRANVP